MTEEKIPSYLPDDYEIIKHVEDDGTTTYCHSVGNEIPIDDETLYTLTDRWFSKIKSVIDLLPDDDYGRFGHLFETLVQTAQSELREVHEFLNKTIGEIDVDIVSRGHWMYRTGRVVSVSLKAREATE